MNTSSYTAAGTLPAKVIKQAQAIYADGKFKPLHLQISPTNVCQLDCPFCSCANRASNVEMDLAEYLRIIDCFAAAGCKAATITGGGEPTLHRNINEILLGTWGRRIATGLTTNGLSLDRVETDALRTLTWCRVSFSDDRAFDMAFTSQIVHAVTRAPDVDWAFSYVLTASPNWENLQRVIDFANRHAFTHVRIVTDLLDVDSVAPMWGVKAQLQVLGVDDSRVIYQGRKTYQRGAERCLISLIKPVISADGGWYPCCGVQYALEHPSRDFEARMCMGHDHAQILSGQKPFDGSQCARCYYGDYNQVLGAMSGPIEHEFFV